MRKLIPTLLGYLLGNDLQPVSRTSRLPVNATQSNADPSIVRSLTVAATQRDLFGNYRQR